MSSMERVARWAFIAFVIIAILMGLIVGYMRFIGDVNFSNMQSYTTLALLILGIIVGLVSITSKEVTPFLIAAIALIVASSANVWAPLANIHELLYDWAAEILLFIVAFVAPAAVINSIKAVLETARTK